MQYEWYIDVYFLVNFGMDFFLLKLLGTLMKIPVPVKRLAAGAAVGAVGSCISVLLWRFPMVISNGAAGLLTVMAMLGVSFRPKTLRSFVKTLLLFFMEAFCIGGMLEALYQHMRTEDILAGMPFLAVGFGVAGVWFAFRFLWLNMTELGKEQKYLYQVRLTAGEATVRTVGYLDTGNCLKAPEQMAPVHIVSEELWKRLKVDGNSTIPIPFRTIGNPLGVMEGRIIDTLEIREDTGEKRILSGVWIARAPFRLTKDGSYEILLHKDTFDS